MLMIVSLALTSNKHVAQDEFAVTQNHFTTHISGVKEQGTYFIPLGSELKKFKRKFQVGVGV